jgi:beta-1,4-mannosyl-glycoprotein beta-1,4-N-acetylglucosaminyltransferase
MDWFRPYEDKIHFLVDESEYISGDAWANEYHHRNFATQFILNDYPTEQFVCSVCDCDEIPDISVVESIGLDTIYYKCYFNLALMMSQKCYYYNLNCIQINLFTKAFFINDTSLKKIGQFQIIRDSWLQHEHMICGWHCSCFLTVEDIQRKLKSFSHTECNIEEYNNRVHIEDCIVNCKDLINRGTFTRNTDFSNIPKILLDFSEEMIKEQINESKNKKKV